MSDLVAFLRARLDEDQAADVHEPGCYGFALSGDKECCRAHTRWLREVEAKRKILDEIIPLIDGMDAQINSEWGSGWTESTGESDALLKIMAAVYSEHPDYDPAWGGSK